MLPSLSFPFTPIELNGKIIFRPILQVILSNDQKKFPTGILVDSGADYSILQREIAEYGLNMDISKLEKIGSTCGIAGRTDVALINLDMKFGTGRYIYTEKIPFRVSLDETKDPPISLLGRDPFFYKYRVD